MSTTDMRGHVIKAYPGDTWRKTVLTMSDAQVLAMYKSLQKRGKVK